ncbi:hypothetical protein KUV47_00465 [Vannielia litorea]|uniref:hypothetical protein n=1 Tax=Vannielia litorea TaxID=1217970 RepID=UPI001C95D1DC|nr:hypothetical protein [Vannielia litorea]MBY6151669.1 hypothetical protein [Vannielia litorea]
MTKTYESRKKYPKPDPDTRFPHNPFPFPEPRDIPEHEEVARKVFLLIRNNLADNGARPVASLGGGSPDITVEGPTTTLITLTNVFHLVPEPGSDQRISARIWNLGGDAAMNARIRFWEVRTLQGSPPEPQLIGQAFRGIPAESTIVVQCPVQWRPVDAHRVSVMVEAADSSRDPVTSPFAPLSDRHFAQKIICSN